MTTTTARTASDKQIAFAARLVSEKALPDGFAALDAASMDVAQASRYIDWLLALPRKAVAAAPAAAAAVLSPGLYVLDGDVYKVQASRESGNLYAKLLVREADYEAGFWSYAPGAMRRLGTARRLTLDEAAEYGRETGTCMICSRTLTDPESIAAGIGPVCAARI